MTSIHTTLHGMYRALGISFALGNKKCFSLFFVLFHQKNHCCQPIKWMCTSFFHIHLLLGAPSASQMNVILLNNFVNCSHEKMRPWKSSIAQQRNKPYGNEILHISNFACCLRKYEYRMVNAGSRSQAPSHLFRMKFHIGYTSFLIISAFRIQFCAGIRNSYNRDISSGSSLTWTVLQGKLFDNFTSLIRNEFLINT